ncbi:hypothetical protein N9T96_00930 [Flavobacteriaceae bacterium]|nr:hypothetical protein [Flavobacteriaceae bacterium]
MEITKHYSNFLQQLKWNYFITCRTPYKIHTMTVRNWITKLLKTSDKVENVFYVSERDKGDYHNLHAHMLIGTNTDMTYKEVKYGLGNVSVGDYQPIYDSEDVCKYVSKHIGKNVDYDIVFKEIS